MQLNTKYCPNSEHPVTMLVFFQSKTFDSPVHELPFLRVSALFSSHGGRDQQGTVWCLTWLMRTFVGLKDLEVNT